jgi:hypothetical protein
MSRNSGGPLVSRRFRFSSSSAGSDGSTLRSIACPAISRAFDAPLWLPFRGGCDPASAISTKRRIASEREGAPVSAAHLSIAAVSSAGSLMAETGSWPVAGRPLFFRTTVFDRAIYLYYTKSEPRGSANFPPGSNPQHGVYSMSRAPSQIDRRTLIRAGTAAGAAAIPTAGLSAPSAGATAPVEEARSRQPSDRPNVAAPADPIYAAIERHRAAYDEHGAALEASKDKRTQRQEQACDAAAEAARALFRTIPTTAPGVRAALSYVVNHPDSDVVGLWMSDSDDDDEVGHTALHRSLLTALDRLWVRSDRRATASAEPDPVFDLIEAHRATIRASEQWPGRLVVHLTPDQEAEQQKLLEADDEAACALDITPTTVAGAIALLRHVAEVEGDGGDYPQERTDGQSVALSHFVMHNVADALEDLS